ncbi:MAG: bifunctional adenosylcobinamide kinase/adenosylcobinamide-phosphate guanylyltransferase [Candidatus Aureabacteria bacterium]|nr:bifunctional adenosylcobinamide kinase/adenosylcobinamide-phosphate guanylyltransferase [Candidatus Auribacterota bacterium]
MKRIIFITGSVRSGKSDLAVRLAKERSKKVVFLATCKPADDEMRERVDKHKKERPKDWGTIEEEKEIASVIANSKADQTIIIDCLTLWISNLLMSGLTEQEIKEKIGELIDALQKTYSTTILVSNEVGWGIVPENKIARMFRDIMGRLHQRIGCVSDEVYLVVSGIPMTIKGENLHEKNGPYY